MALVDWGPCHARLLIGQHLLCWRGITVAPVSLTFTIPQAISADDKLIIFFLFAQYFPYFLRKQDLTFHANCLHLRQFA